MQHSAPERSPDDVPLSTSVRSGPLLLNRQRRARIATRELRDFLRRMRDEIAPGRDFALCLVSDSVMRSYNHRFRGKNAPADVLSFPDGANGRAGDLLVSVETARRQARRLGHSLPGEIKVLALHGLLHLLGFDHHTPRDRARMARAERYWRAQLGLPQGLIERADAGPRSKVRGRSKVQGPRSKVAAR